MRARPTLTRLGIATAITVVTVAAAGCGSSSTTTTTGAAIKMPTTTVPMPATDAAIAAMVPAAIRSTGTLTIATQTAAAPLAFTRGGATAPSGFDIDLATAIAHTLGLSPSFAPGPFTSILPSTAAGTTNTGIGAVTITRAREGQVDFVEYFRAGQSIFGTTGNTAVPTRLTLMCGHTITVPSGSVELASVTAASAACTAAGKSPIGVLAYPTQTQMNAAVVQGQALAGLTDTPIVAWQHLQSSGALSQYGSPFAFAPYGIAVTKGSGLAPAIAAALAHLRADGAYAALLSKWGIGSGAVATFTVDPAVR